MCVKPEVFVLLAEQGREREIVRDRERGGEERERKWAKGGYGLLKQINTVFMFCLFAMHFTYVNTSFYLLLLCVTN